MKTDTIVEALSNGTRREALKYLSENNKTSYNDLADQLYEDPEEGMLKLHHVHIPKLEEIDVVEASEDTVEYQQHEEVEYLLDEIEAI